MSFSDQTPSLAGSRRAYAFHVGGWPAALVGMLVGAIALTVALLFSLVVLPVLLVAGAIAAAYVWWRTRALRKALREGAGRSSIREREVDGELLHVDRPVPPRA